MVGIPIAVSLYQAWQKRSYSKGTLGLSIYLLKQPAPLKWEFPTESHPGRGKGSQLEGNFLPEGDFSQL